MWSMSASVFVLFSFGYTFALTCEEFKTNLSSHIGTVTECFSVHVSPVSLCGWCDHPLKSLLGELSNSTSRSPSGPLCMELLISTDKAFLDLIRFIEDIWSRSFCSYCLANQSDLHPEDHGDTLHQTSHQGYTNAKMSHNSLEATQQNLPYYNMKAYNKETVKFFILLSATLECFDAHIKNKSVSILDSLSFPAIDQLVVDRSACNICSKAYQDMLEFYNKKIVRLNVDQGEFRIVEYKKFTNDRFAVCFDIQHALNRTEWVWSDLLNCQYSDKFTPHILLPVIVCLITFVTFHTLMCTVFLRPMRVWVYQPKRVALRRSHVSTSRPQGQITYVTSYGSLASSSLQQFESTDSLLRHTHHNKDCDEHSHLLSR